MEFKNVEDTRKRLAEANYIASKEIATIVFLAAATQKASEAAEEAKQAASEAAVEATKRATQIAEEVKELVFELALVIKNANVKSSEAYIKEIDNFTDKWSK